MRQEAARTLEYLQQLDSYAAEMGEPEGVP